MTVLLLHSHLLADALGCRHVNGDLKRASLLFWVAHVEAVSILV